MSESSIQTRFHPLTGAPLIPICFRGKNGIEKFVWPVLGGSQPTGEPGGGSTDGSGGTGDGTGSTGGGTDGDGTGGGSTGGSGTGGGSTGSAETDPDKLRSMLADSNRDAAEKRHAAKALQVERDALAAKLKAHEDKDKSELERAQGDLELATKRATDLESTVKELRIANAFLSANKHDWQNAETARRLADLSEVSIDEDGKVSGLDKALEKLAKDHPYLLKPQGNGAGAAGGSSGAPAGSTGSGHSTKDSRAAIGSRFPAATRRR